MCKLDNAANKTNIAFFISSNNFYRANVVKVSAKQPSLLVFVLPRRILHYSKVMQAERRTIKLA